MTWEVQLDGNDDYLNELAKSLAEGDPLLVQRDGSFFLRSSSFEPMAEAALVREEARRLITAAAGILAMALGGNSELQVSRVIRTREDGGRDITIQVQAAQIRISGGGARVSVARADGSREHLIPEDQADPCLKRWIGLAATHETVATSLRLRGAGELRWSDWYRLYEVIVKDGLGGETQVASRGWSSRKELDRFCRTANSKAAAGDAARHGIERSQPPANPMTLGEAKKLIDGLLRNWLDELTLL